MCVVEQPLDLLSTKPQSLRPRPWAATLIVALVFVCGSGCVQRRLIVRSDPPGAMVYVDNFPIGTTPVGANFTYYGTREIRLVRDGYETVTDYVTLQPPWYEYFPLEFVSENLIPATIQDRRELSYQLRPQPVVPTEQLVDRANGLRQAVQAETGGRPPGGNPPPAAVPMPTPPAAQQLPPGAAYHRDAQGRTSLQ